MFSMYHVWGHSYMSLFRLARKTKAERFCAKETVYIRYGEHFNVWFNQIETCIKWQYYTERRKYVLPRPKLLMGLRETAGPIRPVQGRCSCANPGPDLTKPYQGYSCIYKEVVSPLVGLFHPAKGCVGSSEWRSRTGQKTSGTHCYLPSSKDPSKP